MQIVALSWFASAGIGLVGLVVVVLWVLGLIDVFRRPDLDRAKRFAWILIIILLPLIGTIGYFYLRPTLPNEHEQAVRAATSSSGSPKPPNRRTPGSS